MKNQNVYIIGDQLLLRFYQLALRHPNERAPCEWWADKLGVRKEKLREALANHIGKPIPPGLLKRKDVRGRDYRLLTSTGANGGLWISSDKAERKEWARRRRERGKRFLFQADTVDLPYMRALAQAYEA